MYCGQCGKKLKEDMLFCPYCGKPVVLPEDDDLASPAAPEESLFGAFEVPAAQQESAPAVENERVVSLFDEIESEPVAETVEEEFKPLEFDFDAAAVESEAETRSEEEAVDIEPDVFAAETQPEGDERAKRRETTVIQPPESAKFRASKTYIPVQDLDLDNMFMDEEEEDAYDEYDEEPDFSDGFADEDDYEFEDREEGGFFRRHIRGIVGLLLTLMLIGICVIWAFTAKGQTVLAKLNLAWDAEVYAELGYDAYHNQSSLMAARYYEKAYSHEKQDQNDKYTYAHSAMVAYYEADKLQEATTMMKICVKMQPNNPDPYAEFLILYPDKDSIPWEISELIRQGYQRTGDERLNLG